MDNELDVDIDVSDDLNAFEDEFFQREEKEEKVEVEAPENEAEDTEADEGADDGQIEAPDGEAEEKPKKVNRYQERINELTAKAREAERREVEAKRALDELAKAQQKTPTTPTSNPVVQNDGPTPNDLNDDGSEKYPLGEFDPSYIRDMARHTIDKEWNERKAQDQKDLEARQVQEARDQLQTQWQEKLAPVTELHEDFLDKTMELESTFEGLEQNYADYLVQTIKSLDHGPEVLYYFANNLEEAQKFVKMGPLNATLALGEINAMFKGNKRPTTKVSNAPVPPQVATKGSSVSRSVVADTDDLDAFSKEFFKKRK